MKTRSDDTRIIHCPTCQLDKTVKRKKNGSFPVYCSLDCVRPMHGKKFVTLRSSRLRPVATGYRLRTEL